MKSFIFCVVFYFLAIGCRADVLVTVLENVQTECNARLNNEETLLESHRAANRYKVNTAIAEARGHCVAEEVDAIGARMASEVNRLNVHYANKKATVQNCVLSKVDSVSKILGDVYKNCGQDEVCRTSVMEEARTVHTDTCYKDVAILVQELYAMSDAATKELLDSLKSLVCKPNLLEPLLITIREDCTNFKYQEEDNLEAHRAANRAKVDQVIQLTRTKCSSANFPNRLAEVDVIANWKNSEVARLNLYYSTKMEVVEASMGVRTTNAIKGLRARYAACGQNDVCRDAVVAEAKDVHKETCYKEILALMHELYEMSDAATMELLNGLANVDCRQNLLEPVLQNLQNECNAYLSSEEARLEAHRAANRGKVDTAVQTSRGRCSTANAEQNVDINAVAAKKNAEVERLNVHYRNRKSVVEANIRNGIANTIATYRRLYASCGMDENCREEVVNEANYVHRQTCYKDVSQLMQELYDMSDSATKELLGSLDMVVCLPNYLEPVLPAIKEHCFIYMDMQYYRMGSFIDSQKEKVDLSVVAARAKCSSINPQQTRIIDNVAANSTAVMSNVSAGYRAAWSALEARIALKVEQTVASLRAEYKNCGQNEQCRTAVVNKAKSIQQDTCYNDIGAQIQTLQEIADKAAMELVTILSNIQCKPDLLEPIIQTFKTACNDFLLKEETALEARRSANRIKIDSGVQTIRLACGASIAVDAVANKKNLEVERLNTHYRNKKANLQSTFSSTIDQKFAMLREFYSSCGVDDTCRENVIAHAYTIQEETCNKEVLLLVQELYTMSDKATQDLQTSLDKADCRGNLLEPILEEMRNSCSVYLANKEAQLEAHRASNRITVEQAVQTATAKCGLAMSAQITFVVNMQNTEAVNLNAYYGSRRSLLLSLIGTNINHNSAVLRQMYANCGINEQCKWNVVAQARGVRAQTCEADITLVLQDIYMMSDNLTSRLVSNLLNVCLAF